MRTSTKRFASVQLLLFNKNLKKKEDKNPRASNEWLTFIDA